MGPIRLLVHGASGRMGEALLRVAREDARLRIVAAVARRAAPSPAQAGIWLSPERLDSAPEFDVAVDFSLPSGFDRILALVRSRRAALVSGTTGLEPQQREALDHAGAEIAVLWAANFSLGVAVLSALARRAAAALPGWDCDLIEAHHVHKRDAPSGTALALGQDVAQGRGAEPRYHSLRAGDIVGEHSLQFTAAGERLELVHRATSRDIFARGALECAVRIAGRGPGRVAVSDLILP